MGVGRIFLGHRLRREARIGLLLAAAFAVGAAPLAPLMDAPPAVEAAIDQKVQSMGPALSVYRRASLGGAGGLMPDNITAALLALPESVSVEKALPVLQGSVEFHGANRLLLGLDAADVAAVLPWWEPSAHAGGWPNASQVWVGRRLAAEQQIRVGESIAIANASGQDFSFVVTAVLSTAGAEDDGLVVPLPSAQRLLGREGLVSAVLLRVSDLGALSTLARAIEQRFPFLEAKTVLQLTEGHRQVVSTFRVLAVTVAAASGAAAALTAVSVAAISLRRRTHELALLRALGARPRDVASYLGCEIAVFGAAGAAAGYAAGVATLLVISPSLFGVLAMPSPSSAAAAAGLSLGVGVLVLRAVSRGAVKRSPWQVLRIE